jgi:P-type E1-E2 ATPase
VHAFNKGDEKKVASLAASADFFSAHPVAHAVIRYADDNGIAFEKTEEFEEHSGQGSHAILNGKKIICGKISFLESEGVTISAEQENEIEKIKEDGSSSILPVALDGNLVGLILLEDEVRPEAKETIEKLHHLGVEHVVMLTGDNEKVAKKIAYIKKYLNKDNKVAMIGDGVNDAAALALADVGIAMGALGTDAAIEAADIALMKDDFSKVAEAVEMGRAVEKISRQDFWYWGIANATGLVLVFTKIIGPEGAAAYNFITDFFPLLNSMRMFGFNFPAFNLGLKNKKA